MVLTCFTGFVESQRNMLVNTDYHNEWLQMSGQTLTAISFTPTVFGIDSKIRNSLDQSDKKRSVQCVCVMTRFLAHLGLRHIVGTLAEEIEL